MAKADRWLIKVLIFPPSVFFDFKDKKETHILINASDFRDALRKGMKIFFDFELSLGGYLGGKRMFFAVPLNDSTCKKMKKSVRTGDSKILYDNMYQVWRCLSNREGENGVESIEAFHEMVKSHFNYVKKFEKNSDDDIPF